MFGLDFFGYYFISSIIIFKVQLDSLLVYFSVPPSGCIYIFRYDILVVIRYGAPGVFGLFYWVFCSFFDHYKLAKFKTSNCSGQRSLSAATARPKDSVAGQGRRGGCHHRCTFVFRDFVTMFCGGFYSKFSSVPQVPSGWILDNLAAVTPLSFGRLSLRLSLRSV